jgi:lipid II isoglutaminyl synthase (glutamine-hydrolysing)
MTNRFYITHLYPKELSIYGDQGNILALQYFLRQIGWDYVYQTVEIGDNLPRNNDFIFIGGGQDKDQSKIVESLLGHKKELQRLVESDTAVLAICGGYQLFGYEFVDGSGQNMKGLEIFPVTTKSMDSEIKSRCIGNLIIKSQLLNCNLIGFENHGGQTYPVENKNFVPLGEVISGYGNNFVQKVEGCIHKNAVGTYLHGSCLPKNPELTMWFVNQVLEKKKKNNEIGLGLYYMVKQAKVNIEIALTTKNKLIERFTS